MTDPIRDAAIEAAARAMADDWNPDRDPILTAMFRDYAQSAVDAALAVARPAYRAEGMREWADGATQELCGGHFNPLVCETCRAIEDARETADLVDRADAEEGS